MWSPTKTVGTKPGVRFIEMFVEKDLTVLSKKLLQTNPSDI